MALSIQSNVASLASSTLNASRSLDRTVTRLSSGMRINTTQDDAAGLGLGAAFRVSQQNLISGLGAADSQTSSSTPSSVLGGLRSGAYSIDDVLSRANATIRDVNIAEETASLSRSQVLMQAGLSTLAQANAVPQLAMALLRG
jgi:flagellin